MDVKRIIPLFCLLAVLVFGAMKLRDGFMKMMAIDVHQQDESFQNLPQNLSRDYFGHYLRAPVPLPDSLQGVGIRKECENYVKRLLGLDLLFLGDSSFNVTYEQLIEPNSACSLDGEDLQVDENDYLKNCFLSNPVRQDSLSDVCAHALLPLRSAITQAVYRRKRVSDIESLPILTELLYEEAIEQTRESDPTLHASRVKEIIDRMLDLRPHFKVAKKISIYLRIENAVSLAQTRSVSERQKLWAEIEKDFDPTIPQNHTEDLGVESIAFVRTHGYEPVLTVNYAKELVTANPNNAWAEFLSAYSHWITDEHELSFSELKKAVDLDPGNEDYSRVLRSLMTTGGGAQVFTPGLKLGISLQDFDK